MFANVLTNAAVHNEDQVTVEMYAEERGSESVVVGMANDGAGGAADVREDIFEMSVKAPDGTGFGLEFVRALIESYGGGIELRDSDQGAPTSAS